jgi:class 3 adenylate cyclase
MNRPDERAGTQTDARRPVLETIREGLAWLGDLDPIRLRFRNPDIERWFRAHFASHNVTNIRIGHVLGLVMWIGWGTVLRRYMAEEQVLDLIVRYAVMVPMTALGFALTFSRYYPRLWKWPVMAVLLATGLIWIFYATEVESMPPDYGYVGLILIQTFAFSILRLPFALFAFFNVVTIPSYFIFTRWTGKLDGVQMMVAIAFLGSFTLLGLIASYVLEWKMRKLFLRERQLDVERERSDALLLNILPQAIIDRLKARRAVGDSVHLAEAFDDVTVLFADAVDFSVQAAKTSPEDLVTALDDIFCRFDELADRYGLEKIKTVGDAYMAVAGVPRRRPDHADAAAQMALGMLQEVRNTRWPSGDPVDLRVGMASGPAVAGVIGNRKFAYDLWGDTVNLASRLETNGHPGRILASESVVRHLHARYEFGPPLVLDLKGKGPTPARLLLTRKTDGSSDAPTPGWEVEPADA